MRPTLETLCLGCGLCCDGTLFARVPVSASEGERLSRHSVDVQVRPDGSLALPQRCAALNGCACRVYEDRPERCRQYQCNLYSAVAEGEVSAEEAAEVIEGAKQRIAELARVFDDDVRPDVVSRFRDALAGPLAPEVSAEARAAFEELQSYLDRHFRGRSGRL